MIISSGAAAGKTTKATTELYVFYNKVLIADHV